MNQLAAYAWEKGKSKQVVYLTEDRRIYELYVTIGGSWHYADLTALTGAPVAKRDFIDGYGFEKGSSKQVVFLADDGHIHELYVTIGGSWSHADLTALTGAPTPSYLADGYAWENGNSKQVVYVTLDGHVHELYVTIGGSWSHADLTALTGAPVAKSGLLLHLPHGYAWEKGSSKQVVFLANDGHIHELYVTIGGSWSHADLTTLTGHPPIPSPESMDGYAWEEGNSKQVVFVADDGHIHELYVTIGGSWSHADLTERAGAPKVLGSSIQGYAWKTGGTKQVVWLTNDGHIHELCCPKGGDWGYVDLTKRIGAPTALGGPIQGYAWEAGGSKQVVYLTGDGHIHELYCLKGDDWRHADLTQITGAPNSGYKLPVIK